MTHLPALTKREFTANFYSPMAYVVATFYLIFSGLSFYIILSSERDSNAMRSLLTFLGFIHTIFIPMVTMRLIAEERRAGNMELLLTYPLRDGEILLGKFLAALVLYMLILALTLFYPVTVAWFTRLEWGAVATGYLGLSLIGAAFLSVGLFVSSTTENQIVAGFGTFGVLLGLWLLGWFSDTTQGALRTVVQQAGIIEHMDSFAKGVLETKDIVYYVSVTGFALFLALRSLDSHRWRG